MIRYMAKLVVKENAIVVTILTQDLPIVKNVKKDIITLKDYALDVKRVLQDVKSALIFLKKIQKIKDLNVKNV